MSEMSDMFKLVNAMELAKTARVGMSLTYFDVIELLGELKSLYEYIDELEAERRWVPVSEGTKGLEILEDYLTTDESGEISKMKYCGVLRGVQKWLWSDNAFYHPTHWMPLPELPEVQE